MPWQRLDLSTDPDEPAFDGDPADLIDAHAELLELFRRPAWHAQAACRGLGPRAWFPGPGESLGPARAACAACPVAAECHAAAMAEPMADGIWAGLNATERRDIRNGRPLRQDRRQPVPTATLVAFVEATAVLTWADRLERWNDEHPERPFPSPEAMGAAWRYVTAEVA
jgi:WhiB family redox-sensing transcriptional regulator